MRAGVKRGQTWPILVATVWAVAFPWCSRLTATTREANDVEPRSKGVVNEGVGKGSALEKAGVRTGDVVLWWERPPSPPAHPETERGTIDSVFDWLWLEVEQAPLGMVKLFGERDGEYRFFEVAIGDWAWKVRPRLQDRLLLIRPQRSYQVMGILTQMGSEAFTLLDGSLRRTRTSPAVSARRGR